MHTAVRISQEYDNGVVHVLDASRSVPVAGTLLNKENKADYLQGIATEYNKLRVDFGNKRSAKPYLSFEQAQKNAVKIDWENYVPPVPSFLGTLSFDDYDLHEIREYIDWAPFFIAWELGGRFPDLLTDEVIGKEATKLYNDANALLDIIIREKWLTAKAVIGFFKAEKSAPDTVMVTPTLVDAERVSLDFLRQQVKKTASEPNISLADFIVPHETNKQDYIGAFAVTIHGIEPYLEKFQQQHDDYNKITLQALADRLAEAFTELLHKKVRTEFWAYAANEALDNQELIKEKYVGIRPAPGYPACPDHTEKYKLFYLLQAEKNTGITLTESLAMYPASSVCGWYFSHPQSKYFGIGRIQEDQYKDYNRRKGWSEEEAERWLRPVMD